MELVHDFTVPVPAEQAFGLLIDLQRIAPCMPGAVITSVDGDTFEGGMKIKLGPISMTYRGHGELVEKDPVARRAVIRAEGRDAKGNGGAQATVTAALTEHSGTTGVHVITDLNVTGKAAQFGSGVMRDVSNRMLAQFADNLSQMISSGAAGAPAPAPATAPPSSSSATSGSTTASAARDLTPNDEGLDAMGLLLGTDALNNVVRPTLIGLTGLVVGYLYGKNRVLERTVRRGC